MATIRRKYKLICALLIAFVVIVQIMVYWKNVNPRESEDKKDIQDLGANTYSHERQYAEAKIQEPVKTGLRQEPLKPDTGSSGQYQPNWESIDKRPLPAWFDDSKIGIFIHWGVFSVPSFGSEWFWHEWKDEKHPDTKAFMKHNFRPNWTYANFASDFTAEFYDPGQWAELFQASGARYVVLTSKHHEGYTNWPSKYSWPWNSLSLGPRKDLVGALAQAIRKKTNLRFGLYHSLYEWFNPLYLHDKANKFMSSQFIEHKIMPEMYELVNTYKPEVLWSDGDWEAKDVYWKSTEFLAWLYNDSPVKETVVTNDRWGDGVHCKHGDFLTCHDRYNPGKLQKKKWENCMTLDKKSWGFVRDSTLNDYMTIEELIDTVVESVSCGGNILINIGPTKEGTIIPIYEEKLRQLGQWLKVNGEAIYSTEPWTHQNDSKTPRVWYTSKKTQPASRDVYAIALDWPRQPILVLNDPVTTSGTSVSLLGYGKPLTWTARPTGKGIVIDLPVIPFHEMPCEWAWVFKLKNLNTL